MPVPNTHGTTLSDAVQRMMGDTLTGRYFGAVGDGITDDAPAINKALQTLLRIGGRRLYIPGRIYALGSPIVFPVGLSNVEFCGDKNATLFKRIAANNMPVGKGLFDVQGATRITFRDFMVDSNVLTPTTLLYSSITDPLQDSLTLNTTFWIHGGSDILFDGVEIIHSGGYAIQFDARTAFLDRATIQNCYIHNNRPHLFSDGTTAGGSWTGGVHYQGDGANYAVRNLTIYNNVFERNAGNNIQGHAYGLTKLHEHIIVSSNKLTDTGLDAIETGAVSSGSIDNNSVRRVGYVTQSDTDTPIPIIVPNHWAVGLDTSGLVMNTPYQGNTIVSPNGAGIDLDGYSDGQVSQNSVIVPKSSDPRYGDDQIGGGQWGFALPNRNWVYGAQISNTNRDATAGSNVSIDSNNFVNLGGGAVKMYASRNGFCTNNLIDHPADAGVAPIVVGNIGTTSVERSYGNTVSGNSITYTPTSPVAVVQEDAQYGAFQSTDVNWVFDNTINPQSSNAYPFYKASGSSSTTQTVHASAKAQLTQASNSIVQREDSLLRTYTQNGSTVTSAMSLLDSVSLPNSQTGGPLLNVTKGAGTGGVVTTGPRLTSAFDDATLTGKSYIDSFLAMTDTTYADADANLLPGTVALLRWNSTLNKWRQSISVASGVRVWTDFNSGAASVAGADTQVQVNMAGVMGASANFTWNNINQLLAVTGKPNTAAIATASGYIQSADGFYTASASATAVNIPNGTIYSLYLASANQAALATGGGVVLVGTSTIPHADSAAKLQISAGYLYTEQGVYTPSTNGSAIQAPGGGVLSLFLASTNQAALATTGGVVLVGTNAIVHNDSAAKVQISNGYGYSDQGWYTPSVSVQAMQAPNGGATAKYLVATDSLFLTANASSPVSAVGQVKFYTDGSHAFISENGGSWTRITGTGITVPGANQQVIFNSNGALGTSANFYYNGTTMFVQSLGLKNANPLFFSDTGGTYRSIMQIYSDNNLYIDNNWQGGLNIYLRASNMVWSNSSLSPTAVYGTGLTYGLGAPGFAWVNNYFSGNTGLYAYDAAGSTGTLQLYNTNGNRSKTWRQDNTGSLYLVNTSGTAITVNDDSGNMSIFAALSVGSTVSAAGGLATTNTSFNAIQAPSGGVHGLGLTAIRYTQVGNNSGIPAMLTNDSLQFGCLYYDTGLSALRFYTGAGWQTVASSSGGGVTSVIGANGINVSTSSGTATVSLASSISVSSIAVSSSFAANGAFTVSASNLAIDNSGNISTPAVIHISGVSGGLNVSASSSYNAIQTTGGVLAGIGFFAGSSNSPVQICDGFGRFPSTRTVYNGNTYSGITYTFFFPTPFQVNGNNYQNLVVINGLVVQFY